MPNREIEPLEYTMCQHDFSGNRIFQHRNMDKWATGRRNERIAGFLLEAECLAFLDELEELWTDLPAGVRRWCAQVKNEIERRAVAELCGTTYRYIRVGYDERPMTFHDDGTVGMGAAGREVFWDLRRVEEYLCLEIFSDRSLTCKLQRNGGATWTGRWECYEMMPVELRPLCSEDQ